MPTISESTLHDVFATLCEKGTSSASSGRNGVIMMSCGESDLQLEACACHKMMLTASLHAGMEPPLSGSSPVTMAREGGRLTPQSTKSEGSGKPTEDERMAQSNADKLKNYEMMRDKVRNLEAQLQGGADGRYRGGRDSRSSRGRDRDGGGRRGDRDGRRRGDRDERDGDRHGDDDRDDGSEGVGGLANMVKFVKDEKGQQCIVVGKFYSPIPLSTIRECARERFNMSRTEVEDMCYATFANPRPNKPAGKHALVCTSKNKEGHRRHDSACHRVPRGFYEELRKMCPNTDLKAGAKRPASSSSRRSDAGSEDKRSRRS